MPKPLEGVRIVDLSQLTSGPLATMMLAEQGRRRREGRAPGNGRPVPAVGVHPQRVQRTAAEPQPRQAQHLRRHRGPTEGQALVVELMKGADVVVQNFRPGVVDRLGFGYDAVKAVNPSVIYVSVSGFGPTGPYANRPVVDPIIQALTGIVARQQSEAIPLPDLVRNIIVDKATALTVAQAISAALFRPGAHRRGRPPRRPDARRRRLLLLARRDDGLHARRRRRLPGAAHRRHVRAHPVRRRRRSSTTPPTNDMRLRLFRVLGHPEMCDDPRFKDIPGLMQDDNLATAGGDPGRGVREAAGRGDPARPARRPRSPPRRSSSPRRSSTTSRSCTTVRS